MSIICVRLSSFLTSLEQVLSVDEEVEGVLLRQLYALPDDVVEVVGSQVVGHQVPIKSIGMSNQGAWE